MWAYARTRLGLSRKEFYLLQGRQLDAMIQQDNGQREEREFLFAQATAAIINFSMCRPETPVDALALMPSRWKRKERPRRATKEDKDKIVAGFRTWIQVAVAAQERAGIPT